MASNEAVGPCDQHSRARRDDWRFAVKFERHGNGISGDVECYE